MTQPDIELTQALSALDLAHVDMPAALASIHQSSAVGAVGEYVSANPWSIELLQDTFEGAGFGVRDIGSRHATVERLWTLPDYVAPGMHLLICGLNPSPSSADSGVGFFKAGNRYWPAALKAGLVTVDRDPLHSLHHHGVGMTDMVKRATRRADELHATEYEQGVLRVARLAAWLKPRAICMVGLAGWRAAVSRKAQRGWQPESLGGCPVYLMPSTSGLNAHDTVATLAAHLSTARHSTP